MSNIITISVIVLVNALLIKCSPTVHQDANSVTKFFDNKLAHHSNSTDKGSSIPEFPTFTHLGTFNGYQYFLGRTLVDYGRASNDCAMLGFSLARAGQAELNFFFSTTNPTDDFAWLGGYVSRSLGSFRWNDGSEVNKDIALNFSAATVALALDRYPGNSGLRAFPTDSLHYYICQS